MKASRAAAMQAQAVATAAEQSAALVERVTELETKVDTLVATVKTQTGAIADLISKLNLSGDADAAPAKKK